MTISRYEDMYGKLDSVYNKEFQEAVRCNCSECNVSDCKHRNCYRRLPEAVGGLGLCFRLSDEFSLYVFESHSSTGIHKIVHYLVGANYMDAIDNARIAMYNVCYSNIDKIEILR